MSKDAERMSLEEAESFTSDQITSAIKSCRSSRAYGPDSLSIFHLKNLEPLATEHLTALYTDSHKARTHCKASRYCAQLPRSSRRSSYPLSTNFSHRLKDQHGSDTRLHLPSSSSQQTSRHNDIYSTKRIQPARGWCATVKKDCANCIHLSRLSEAH